MNNFEIHDAAIAMAAGRTAYSLAREVLGLRAQVAELRDTLAQYEAQEGQEITALRQELEAAIEIAERAGCAACESRPGQFHSPECPAVNAFTAGRIGAEAAKA